MSASLAPLMRRGDVRKLLCALGEEECRLVGGVVRDALQGLEIKDIDVATRLHPERMCGRLRAEGIRFFPTGLSHGTVTAWIDDTRFQVTCLRRDEKTDGRHARIVPISDWDEDAERRDFTINAIYADAEGEVHDPLGGAADLRARRVRFVGDPRRRIEEDYLRILRFFRFSASHGEANPDAEGLSACTELRSGLQRISAERIRDELERILLLERGVDAFGWMAESGVLAQCLGGRIEPNGPERYEALG